MSSHSRVSHAQRSLAVYSPWGLKELDTTEKLSARVHTHKHTYTQTHTHRHTHTDTHTHTHTEGRDLLTQDSLSNENTF